MKNHRKRILIIGGTIIALALIIWFFYDYYQVLNKIDKDYYQIEYGQKIPDSLYDYVNPDKIHSKINNKDFHVSVKGQKEGTKRLLNGVYQVQLKYRNETVDVKVEIKDTQKPQFTSFKDKIVLVKDSKDDLVKKDYWKAIDKLNDGTTEDASIKIEGKYDLSKAGKYKVNIIATDKNKLETSQETTIEVLSYEQAYKKGLKDKNNKDYTSYCKKKNEEKAKEKRIKQLSSSSRSNMSRPTGVRPNASVIKQSHKSSNVTSGRRVYFNDTTAMRNASDKFPEYKELCQFIYDFYNSKNSKDTYSLPVSKETTDDEIINLIKQIYSYMFPNYDFYKTNISVFRRHLGENYSMSITIPLFMRDEYTEMKEMNQWIKSQGYSGLTESQVVFRLNAYLRDKTNYDYSFADISYTPKGILYNRKAVCAGYADFFKMVCDNMNIPCQYISGLADNGVEIGGHAWNRVKLGGTWYYIDTCWNACLKNNNYYLSRTLWSDHTVG